jgi:cytochrome P450
MFKLVISKISNLFQNNHFYMADKLKVVKYSFPWLAILKIGQDPLGFLNKHHKDTGKLYRVDAPIKFAVVSDHENIRHILQKNWRSYSKGTAYEGFRLMLGNGILTSSGDEWKRNRKLIKPGFTKEHINTIASEINTQAIELCANLKLKEDAGEFFEAKNEMILFSLSVISKIMLGGDCANRYQSKLLPIIEREYDFVLKRNLSILKLPMWIPTRRHLHFHESKKEMDTLIYEIIEEKKKQNDETIYSMVVHAKDEDGLGMSDLQLRDEFITLYATGFETTGSALVWTLLLLSRHTEIQERLFGSIKSIDPNDTASVLKNELLNAVVKESLRIYPPAWVITRKCEEEDEIDGVRIPKNTNFLICIYNAHRDEDYWENPDQFNPDRFLNTEKDNPSYLPYGVGPRMCMGNHISNMEIVMTVFQMVLRFQISMGKEHDFDVDPKITLMPKGDVWLKTTSRAN